MKMYKLRREQLVERPLSEVFALFERPENLALISPPAMEYILFTPRPIEKKVGTLIDFSVRVFGIRMHWTSMITDYLPPYRFVEVQLKGPYTFWHHTHRFDESSRGTLIIDDVRYVLPFGPLGRLVHALFVKRKIEKIFDYRAQVAKRTFGEGQTNT
jgi:ligand-binding SRPBCC domain-containing protein